MKLNAAEKITTTKLETAFLQNKRRNIYIALENLGDDEWIWDECELKKFRRLWKEEVSIKSIARILKRSETSVFLLSLDQIDKSYIQPRSDWKIR